MLKKTEKASVKVVKTYEKYFLTGSHSVRIGSEKHVMKKEKTVQKTSRWQSERDKTEIKCIFRFSVVTLNAQFSSATAQTLRVVILVVLAEQYRILILLVCFFPILLVLSMYHFLQLAVSHSLKRYFQLSMFDASLAVCGAEIERKEREQVGG